MSRLIGIIFWSAAAVVWLGLAFVLGWSAVLVALCCAAMACAVATGCMPLELLRTLFVIAVFSVAWHMVRPSYAGCSQEALSWVAVVWLAFFLAVHWLTGKLLPLRRR